MPRGLLLSVEQISTPGTPADTSRVTVGMNVTAQIASKAIQLADLRTRRVDIRQF